MRWLGCIGGRGLVRVRLVDRLYSSATHDSNITVFILLGREYHLIGLLVFYHSLVLVSHAIPLLYRGYFIKYLLKLDFTDLDLIRTARISVTGQLSSIFLCNRL